jgi:hypothetical protein
MSAIAIAIVVDEFLVLLFSPAPCFRPTRSNGQRRNQHFIPPRLASIEASARHAEAH